MSKLLVTKKFTLDFAHALDGYDGPCRNIHGHTYHLEISVLGRVCRKEQSTKTGMVVDFKHLKKLVHDCIEADFDHALVLNGSSEKHRKMATELGNQFNKIVMLESQPTCENILLEFKNRIEPGIRNFQGILYEIKLQETPTSSATWNIHLNDIDLPL